MGLLTLKMTAVIPCEVQGVPTHCAFSLLAPMYLEADVRVVLGMVLQLSLYDSKLKVLPTNSLVSFSLVQKPE